MGSWLCSNLTVADAGEAALNHGLTKGTISMPEKEHFKDALITSAGLQ